MDGELASIRSEVEAAREQARSRRRFVRAARQYRAALQRLDGLGAARAGADDVRAVRARALIGLASCETERGTEPSRTLALLDEAQRCASQGGDTAMVATVRGNRGLLLLRTGDVVAARREFDAAVAGLDDPRELVPVLLNRGTLHLETGALDEAVADLERCRDLATNAAEAVFRPMAEHNLGYARYLRGDLPAALRSMDDAAQVAPPEHAGVGLMDKAVVLFEAGLLTDAEDTLRRAVDLLTVDGASRDLLDALLARSRCLVGLGRHDEALELARDARGRARRAGHQVLEIVAAVAVLEARHGLLLESGEHRDLDRLAADAVELHDAACRVPGTERARVDVALIAADVLVRTGRPAEADAWLARLPRAAELPLGTRVSVEVVRAREAFGAGDRRAGLAAVRRGQRLLASQRLRLGAVEAVTAAAAHGVRLQAVDVEAALRTGRADAVFDAVERGRATFAGAGRVRPSADEETAALVVEARRLLERARVVGADDTDEEAGLLRDARRLQDRARHRAWHASGDAEVPLPTTVRRLRGALRDAGSEGAVVDLALYRGRVLAVRVDASGTSLHDVVDVDEVRERCRRVQADQRILANRLIPEPLREAALGSLATDLDWLDRTLLGELDLAGRPLYVAARDRLASLPWGALPSRRGAATLVNSWVAPARQGRRSGPALVVAGPDLADADREAWAVADVWHDATVLVGAEATCDAVRAGMADASIVHLATHGTHEQDNPVFSSVRLADGPLFAHELDGTDLGGMVVVLSSCDVGVGSTHVGGEPLGLTSVLLRLGARAVIASVAPLRDDVARRVMPVLHRELCGGASPATALATAVAGEEEPIPLVCFGPLDVG
ncbi:CHAT domain-containing protein [Isoptericola sp. b408]|uniref:CHAT domain-containing protein n=1 Tax=Isoptericola sp. b408 TaxID=3064653 RepID=UPI0027136136|nr:CHAT domain-containing protein [Isoptericola sp. b408]MDO8150629.1 CHAT domain-containing protein [Isoptericola sp. b408]